MKKNLTKMINVKTQELYNKKCNKEEFKEKRKELIKFLHEVYSQEHDIKSLHKRLHYINDVENQFTGILNSILRHPKIFCVKVKATNQTKACKASEL